MWGIGGALGVLFWRHWWGIPSAILVFYLQGLGAQKCLALQYALAARSLTAPLKGMPGVDFLLFESEPPETIHKLKIVPDDAGYIYSEDGSYRIKTLKYDFTIPFAEFHHEILAQNGSPKALLFRFRPRESQSVVELAATVKYLGNDLKVAADYKHRCEWASKAIESMKSSQPVA